MLSSKVCYVKIAIDHLERHKTLRKYILINLN